MREEHINFSSTEWMGEGGDARAKDTRMFQQFPENSKKFPEAFTHPSPDFKHVAVSDFLENRKIILLKFVCTSVNIC